ncbi:PilN domain-containing protein [Halanaerobacter jeridensis]|uniref:Tfp pilus assembly protein PilN n=1 Tax=Halanaerobacter jeridensis TaxID=706427 RepID=A0A938XS68_9FIRM|nr:Tfp pilus assembly protein PilN [Halanaerobacter jeridensis]
MVNFLTKEFIWEQRQGLIYFILIILSILLIFAVAYYTINSYLELKLLKEKQQVVAKQNQKLKDKIAQIEKIEEQNANIKEKIETKQQQLKEMTEAKEVWEELSLLASPDIQLQSFEFSEQNFNISGITKDMQYLNLLNRQLEETSLLQKFYLDEINKRKKFVIFRIEGQLQKGE